jgi:hypothetical protein
MTFEELSTEKDKYTKEMQKAYDNYRRIEGIVVYINQLMQEDAKKAIEANRDK